MQVDNLLPAVLECAITLSPVVIIYIIYGFAMPRWSGGLFLVVYLVYVIFALGQQAPSSPMLLRRCTHGQQLACTEPCLVVACRAGSSHVAVPSVEETAPQRLVSAARRRASVDTRQQETSGDRSGVPMRRRTGTERK